MPAEPAAVEATGLTRSHGTGARLVRALDGASLTVRRGEVVAIVGPSGAGKSTLLFLLAGLDRPDSGTVKLAGTDWETLAGKERAAFRRQTCGFVSQGMALLPQATASENVEVPLLLDGVGRDERAVRVAEALEHVGLAAEAAKLPDQLSGGQQQRVAVARALVTEPALVLADEPTGNLDSANGQEIARLLVEAAAQRDAAVVLVTHDPDVAAHATRVLELRSGRLQENRERR